MLKNSGMALGLAHTQPLRHTKFAPPSRLTKRLKCPPIAWEGRGLGISEIEGYWFWCQKYFDLGPNVSQAQFAESLKLFQSSFLTHSSTVVIKSAHCYSPKTYFLPGYFCPITNLLQLFVNHQCLNDERKINRIIHGT